MNDCEGVLALTPPPWLLQIRIFGVLAESQGVGHGHRHHDTTRATGRCSKQTPLIPRLSADYSAKADERCRSVDSVLVLYRPAPVRTTMRARPSVLEPAAAVSLCFPASAPPIFCRERESVTKSGHCDCAVLCGCAARSALLHLHCSSCLLPITFSLVLSCAPRLPCYQFAYTSYYY